MKLLSLSCAWIGGIYLGSRFTPPLYVLLIALILPLLLTLLWRKRQVCLWGGLCLITLTGGVLCYQYRTSEPTLPLYNDQGIVEMKGIVARDPELQGTTTHLRLSAREIEVAGEWKKASGDVLLYIPSLPSYSYGELLQVSGELQEPGEEDKSYLARQGIYSVMYYPEIESIGKGWLFSLRNRLAQPLASALPEPQGSLAQALLLGIRSQIPDSLTNSLRYSGTAHIIAISGLNLTILSGIILSTLAWLFGRRRPTYIVLTLATIWLYALLTGMQPPVFRAAIMISLLLTALWLGRPQSAMPSIALAAAIMVGINPQILADVSFQLSFAAVAGLALLAPPLQTWGRKALPENAGAFAATVSPIIDSFAITLAALIAAFPLIAYYFGYVSLVALPANFFALLAVPGVIVTTLLTAVLGLVAPTLSWVIGWVAWLFLSYTIKVVEGFGALPFASYQIPMNWIVLLAYYGVIVAILSRKRLGMAISKLLALIQARLGKLPQLIYQLPKKWVFISLLIVTTLLWLAVATTPDKHLEVSFLDVGQGDAILIQKGSQQILIDGGPDSEKICLELGKKLPFWDRTIDLVVLTHPHDDHLIGLVEVLQRYKVGQALEPPKLDDESIYNSSTYEEWLNLTEERGIKRTLAQVGQQIDLGNGIKLEVLHPQTELLQGTDSDIDNNGIVLRLVWNEVSFLLTADIHEEAEREMLHQGYRLESTVLKVAHHGSSASTSPQFLAAVDPQMAVICVGNNTFGHPHEETLRRLIEKAGEGQIYLTSKQVEIALNERTITLPERGTITFTTDGKKLWVETEPWCQESCV